MKEIELLRAHIKQQLIVHANDRDTHYRTLYMTQMHMPDGTWVDSFAYQEDRKYNSPIYVRPVTEFQNFTAVDNNRRDEF